MIDYKSVLYSRGYLFSDKECNVPEHFSSIRVSSYYFYHDNLLDVFFYKRGIDNDWILVCGVLLDSEKETSNMHEIACSLLKKRKESKNLFLDYLDSLGGRFVFLISCSNEIEVYHDACGNKVVNYLIKNKNICISSHLGLIETNFKVVISGVEKERRVLNKDFRYGYPGMSTPYRDIKKLTPNTALNLQTKNITRYFPRENIKERSIKSVYNTVKRLFNNQFESLLDLKCKPLISLTAGWDSRFTISILDNLEDASYFTYRSSESHDIDVLLAKVIAKKLNLNHFILHDQDYLFDNNYIRYSEAIDRNTYLRHGREISYMYFNAFKKKNYMHIRSNISEIGRFYYGKCRDYRLNELSLLFLWGSINKDYISSPVIRNAFREYFVKNEYYKLFNYNAFDIFYWEHRMGQWNAEVLVEGDPSFNTIQLFNCRNVLKSLLAISETDRKNDSLYKYAIFNKGIPDLTNVPLNPTQTELAKFLIDVE